MCFYTSVRKKDGMYYKSSLIKSVRAAIDHFFHSPPNKKEIYENSIIRGWEFNKTIIPFALVGYEIGNSQQGT